MTVETTDSTISYTGDGVTTAFAVSFDFFDAEDLEVISRVTATGAETIQVLTTNYTVTGGAGTTGTVTMVAAPAGTTKLFIRRVTVQDQSTSLNSYGPFPAGSVEDGFDKLTMIAQEISRDQSRAVVVPKTETGLTLPNSVERASKYLYFDTLGNPTPVSVLTTGALAVSAYVQTLLNLANSAAFLAGQNTGRVLWGGTATGTGNAIVLTPGTALASYVTGDVVLFLALAGNTTAVTVNISGLGAKNVYDMAGVALVSGAIVAGDLVPLVYDGTQFRIWRQTAKPLFSAVYLDSKFYAQMAGTNATISMDDFDYYQFARATNRHEFYAASVLAPLRVGRGVESDDSVRMDQGWHRLTSQTVGSVVASAVFVLTSYLTAGFTRFRVEFKDLLPASDAALFARFSVDAGATYKSGAADYNNAYLAFNTAGSATGGGATTQMRLTGTDSVESTSTGVNGFLQWTNRASASQLSRYGTHFASSAAALTSVEGTSTFAFASINAVQLLFNAVNINAQGTIVLYGSAE